MTTINKKYRNKKNAMITYIEFILVICYYILSLYITRFTFEDNHKTRSLTSFS